MQKEEATQPTANLGKLISEHSLRREYRLLYQYLGAVGVGGAIVMVTVGVWRAYLAYQNYGPALVWRWSLPSYIAAAGLALVGFGSLLTFWRRHDIKVRAHDNGMAFRLRRKVNVNFWRHVRSIRTSSSRYMLPFLGTSGRSELLLTMTNNRSMCLSHIIAGLDQLVETVKERVYPRLMADYVKAYRMGQDVTFGPLALTLDGIQYRKRTLAWDTVCGAEIVRGGLNILWETGKRVSRLRVPTKKIPNVEICFQLIRRLGLHP
jgi:hypothetical protein